MSVCCLGNGRSRGLLVSCTPTAGGFPLHPFCDDGNGLHHLFSACWLGNEGKCACDRKSHGRNENKEKAGRESSLSPPAFFYCFPRMQKHPDGGASHRPARGRQCGQPIRKTQSSSGKACMRVSLHHRYIACRMWIAKPRMVPHASPENRLKGTDCHIRNWGQGTALVHY